MEMEYLDVRRKNSSVDNVSSYVEDQKENKIKGDLTTVTRPEPSRYTATGDATKTCWTTVRDDLKTPKKRREG